MALMSWHFLLLNCHIWKPNQIVFNLFRNQMMVSDFSFCLLFPHFRRFSIQSCLDKVVWSEKLLLHHMEYIRLLRKNEAVSCCFPSLRSLHCKPNHSCINWKRGLLWTSTQGTGCPHWPGYTVLPQVHTWAWFLSIYFTLLWLLISATANNSGRRKISNTLSRISRESVQSIQVAVAITSFESLIITIWHSEMLRLLVRIIAPNFSSEVSHLKGYSVGESNHKCVLKPLWS